SMCVANGQIVLHNVGDIDTVRITASTGAYLFDAEGTTRGYKNYYVFVFDSASRKYYTTRYHKKKTNMRSRPVNIQDSLTVNRRHLKKYRYRLVNEKDVELLFTSLNDDSQHLDYE